MFSMLHRYIYLDSTLSTVSMGRETQAICHFRNGLRTFEHIDYVRLQQQVIHLYIFEYLLIIMVNARWLMQQLIWSGRIGIYTYLWSAQRGVESAELISI